MFDDDYETMEDRVDWLLLHVRAMSDLVAKLCEKVRQLEKATGTGDYAP